MKHFAHLKIKTSYFENGKIVTNVDIILVEIMAKSGKYLMVRRKGCMPFIANADYIEEVPQSIKK